ncbi:MAG: hypothetical protein AAFN74_03845 [Myxococcota bacterium]
MRPSVRNVALATLLALSTAACERCAPGQVATGVSRLTMRSMGALVEMLNDERISCGFESPEIKAAATFSGPPGAMGTGVWRTENCVIDLPKSDPYISEDCNGVETRVWGRVEVTAERHISGVIAGDDENPVIPGGPDGVTIHIIKARFSEFRVEVSNSDNAMTWTSGAISGSLSPRLAVDDDLGACSFVTSNALITDVQYENSLVRVDTADRSFNVDVGGSNLSAVNGRHSGRENDLWGSLVVWGGQQEVPDDGLGLDPDYNPDLFPVSYECKQGLSLPVSYDCQEFLDPILAQNTSRISMRLIGRVVSILESDTKCGFSSQEVLENRQLEGVVGGIGAATFRVDGCVLDFPEPTVVATACDGSTSIATGRLVVSATKRMEGRLTGDLETPVVPLTDNPAIIFAAVEQFEGFEVAEAGTAIKVHSGAMSGRVEPRVAASTEDSGACSFVTDIIRFSDVRWRPSEITLRADEGTFNATVLDSNLRAVNGYWGGDENMLRGRIELNGKPYQLPTDPTDDGLDPGYERAAFDQAWQCAPLEMPARFACGFDKPLAQGAAQLSVQTFGVMASLIEADERCGFSSSQVIDRVDVDGRLGFDGATATFRIDAPCELSYPEPTIVDTDCNGINTYAQGKARVTGIFTLKGIASGDPLEPIVPTGWDPAALELTGTFDDFKVWTDPGTNLLTIRDGRLSGVVEPRVGIDDVTGACSITTPVARINDLRLERSNIILEQDGLRFDAFVGNANLRATNGQTETATNRLEGFLTMDGNRHPIPTDGEPILNPDYDQATFDRSFACTENLTVPQTEEACNMKQVIGEGVARLLLLATGILAAEVNADEECGFEDFFVQIDPDIVEGDDGEQGRLVWSIDDCTINGSTTQPNSTDCNGATRFMAGRYVLDARRTVRGRRDTDFIIFDSIIPDTPNSVIIELEDARIQNYQIYDIRPDELQPFRAFEVADGRLAAIVEPITGENQQNRGSYDIATPVAGFSAVRVLQPAEVVVFTEGKTFKVNLEHAQLEGFNGSYDRLGITNYIRGEVIIDGTRVFIDAPLDVEYDQVAFDESYACTTDLVSTITPERNP